MTTLGVVPDTAVEAVWESPFIIAIEGKSSGLRTTLVVLFLFIKSDCIKIVIWHMKGKKTSIQSLF